MILDRKNVISMRMSSPSASDQELQEQLELFVEIAKEAGYVISNKFVDYSNEGYNIVEVEGVK